MALFPDDVAALVRTLHVLAAIIWLGGLWFGTFFVHRVLPGWTDAAREQVAVPLVRRAANGTMIAAGATLAFGVLAYIDLALRIGVTQIAWTTSAASALGVVLGFFQINPVSAAWTRAGSGRAPGAASIHASVVSLVVLFLMSAPIRIGGIFQ